MTAVDTISTATSITGQKMTAGQRRLGNKIRKAVGVDTRVYVNRVRGELWASDSYWAAPITSGELGWLFGPNEPEPGVYRTCSNDKGNAAGTMVVERVEGGTALNLEKVAPTELCSADVVLERADLDGVAVFVPTGDGRPAPLFRCPSGQLAAFDQQFIDILVGADSKGFRLTAPAGQGPSKPVAVWRALNYTWQSGEKGQSWVFAGILMPIRVRKAGS